MCGKCCEVIAINESHDDLKASVAGTWVQGRLWDDVWILEHWHPMSLDEAMKLNPAYATSDARQQHLYSCDQYDPVLKLCNAHESRPRICSNFPWYNREPLDKSAPTELDCSYWADVPKEKWIEGVNPMPTRDFIPLPML